MPKYCDRLNYYGIKQGLVELIVMQNKKKLTTKILSTVNIIKRNLSVT